MIYDYENFTILNKVWTYNLKVETSIFLRLLVNDFYPKNGLMKGCVAYFDCAVSSLLQGINSSLSGFRWSDTSNMVNQMEQLMKSGAKFQKSYPWLNWWLTVRKGWSQRNQTALASAQTILQVEPCSTLPLTIWSLASIQSLALFGRDIWGQE